MKNISVEKLTEKLSEKWDSPEGRFCVIVKINNVVKSVNTSNLKLFLAHLSVNEKESILVSIEKIDPTRHSLSMAFPNIKIKKRNDDTLTF